MTSAELHKMLKRGDAHISPVSAANSEHVSSIGKSISVRPAKGEGAINGKVYLSITPVAKPRMTQRDKWKKRPCVLRYRDYCDALRAAWGSDPFPAAGYWIVFYLPMPKSWSKKKKAKMNRMPHQQKPDKDNLEKAVLDALCKEDSYIYDGRVSKYWSDAGYIEIYLNEARQAA